MARRHGSATAAPLERGARYDLWQAMRVLKRFTVAELIATAGVQRSNAEKYVRALLGAGYLAVDGTTPGQSGWRIYRLVRNSGPAAPRIRVSLAVYDANTGELFPCTPSQPSPVHGGGQGGGAAARKLRQ